MRRHEAVATNGWSADAVLARLGEIEADDSRRRRLLATACGAAIALHVALVLFVPRPATRVTLPEIVRAPLALAPTPRFQPPPAAAPAPAPPVRRVPMPDPTPDDIEPLRALAPPAPPLALPIDAGLIGLPIPPAPPAPTLYEVGGEVSAPVKLYAPDPVYPRAAVLARRGGVVIVEATIDGAGRVTALRALSQRGFGLEEAALTAVAEWRFRPALRHGEPVPVLYRLTVNFALAN